MALSEEKLELSNHYRGYNNIKDSDWDALSEAQQSQTIFDFCNDFAKNFCETSMIGMADGAKKTKIQGYLDKINNVITQET